MLSHPECRVAAPLVGDEVVVPGRSEHVGCPAVRADRVRAVVGGSCPENFRTIPASGATIPNPALQMKSNAQ
jgi:hypothetical protein